MKSGSKGGSLLMENITDRLAGMSAQGVFAAICKNLRRNAVCGASAVEKRFAYIKEEADALAHRIERVTGCTDIVDAILTTDEAAHLYRECLNNTASEVPFGNVNRAEHPYFCRMQNRFDRLYLCRCLAGLSAPRELKTLIPLVCGNLADLPAGREKKVAFLRNRQASRAFERFAKYLGGVSAVYEDNFQNACESVYTGEATYAIIPIASTSDGRLNSFYRQMEKYELSIVLCCDIDSDDGENSTTFALVYRDRIYIETGGTPLYECKITFDNITDLAGLADAAEYFGATLESVEALPVMFSGRANAFDMVFGLTGAEISGFFSYLALEYPQTAAVGIYDRTEMTSS